MHGRDGRAVVGLLEEEPVVVRVERAVLLGHVGRHLSGGGGGGGDHWTDTERSVGD